MSIVNTRDRALVIYGKYTSNMQMVTHHSNPDVVTWRDKAGYHNAMIDWQWQDLFKHLLRPNYPVPAIRTVVEIYHDRVILAERLGQYGRWRYLVDAIQPNNTDWQ